MSKIAAIIMAAGRGERMGQPKLFLESAGKSFLELVITALEGAGILDITAVVRKEDRARSATMIKSYRLAVNRHPENGPLSSLRAGLDSAPGFEGYLVVPVDHPFIKPGTIRDLAETFKQKPYTIVKPYCQGKSGHPVIIPASLAEHIAGQDTTGGLAQVIRNSGLAVARLEVNDNGIFRNINTKGDME
jgi:molybdenum cofactor cytidylyltransferase